MYISFTSIPLRPFPPYWRLGWIVIAFCRIADELDIFTYHRIIYHIINMSNNALAVGTGYCSGHILGSTHSLSNNNNI